MERKEKRRKRRETKRLRRGERRGRRRERVRKRNPSRCNNFSPGVKYLYYSYMHLTKHVNYIYLLLI
jgi:hypothetical protein